MRKRQRFVEFEYPVDEEVEEELCDWDPREVEKLQYILRKSANIWEAIQIYFAPNANLLPSMIPMPDTGHSDYTLASYAFSYIPRGVLKRGAADAVSLNPNFQLDLQNSLVDLRNLSSRLNELLLEKPSATRPLLPGVDRIDWDNWKKELLYLAEGEFRDKLESFVTYLKHILTIYLRLISCGSVAPKKDDIVYNLNEEIKYLDWQLFADHTNFLTGQPFTYDDINPSDIFY